LVAAGAIAISMLRKNGIEIGTHISSLAGIADRPFGNLEADLEVLNDALFPVLSPAASHAMQHRIEEAAKEGDSVGGILETAVTGMPAGVGEPWFDSVEGLLSHALFSIPGIKGVEFGEGFGFADMTGSEANDALRVLGGRVVTATNHNGGINGGITNGMPLIFRCAVKPTPSIFREQESVDLSTMKNEQLTLKGRHDPAIIHRARVVVDSITALVLWDLLAQRFGTDFPDAD
jgi:chorismate synthase